MAGFMERGTRDPRGHLDGVVIDEDVIGEVSVSVPVGPPLGVLIVPPLEPELNLTKARDDTAADADDVVANSAAIQM